MNEAEKNPATRTVPPIHGGPLCQVRELAAISGAVAELVERPFAAAGAAPDLIARLLAVVRVLDARLCALERAERR